MSGSPTRGNKVAPPIANRLEMPLTGGATLRVDFDRAGDRWRHRVLLELPPGSAVVGPIVLFESQEGNSDEDWPGSPPLQFVSIETRPKKLPVALLMGMAGGSHWSASIEQYPAEQTLRFDIACRAGSRPEKLGSRYRFGPRVELMNIDDDECRVRFLAGGLAFELSGEAGKDSPLPTIVVEDRELRIHFGEPTGAEVQTYRWVYRVSAR